MADLLTIAPAFGGRDVPDVLVGTLKAKRWLRAELFGHMPVNLLARPTSTNRPKLTALFAANSDTLHGLAEAATSLTDIESAAIFATAPDSSELELAAAAGIDGPPLERLTAAVRNPAHPIARTVTDAKASFDVTPTAPGGPALRSHLPLFAQRDGRVEVVGVLAVAHDKSLDADARRGLTQIAEQAASALGAA